MKLHLIDGTFELFRAHYSKRPEHRMPDGGPGKATLGLASSMLGLLQDAAEAPTHIAIAFDNPIRSFRNELFDGYKTDEGVEPDLLAQFDSAEEAARAVGLTVWSMKNHEADDAIATAAARFASEVEQVRILSPDKDFGQLLRGDKVVLVDRIRNRVIDEASLRARLGISPRSVPDFLALVGDTADGIPGLKGFGEKTVAALLSQYPKLEDIPKDGRAWPAHIRGKEQLAQLLVAEWENAVLYRRLATLVEDAPISASLSDMEWKGVPRARFEQWRESVKTSLSLPERLKTF
jgi:5'-3' exonuclease